jgi:hypothetical protein
MPADLFAAICSFFMFIWTLVQEHEGSLTSWSFCSDVFCTIEISEHMTYKNSRALLKLPARRFLPKQKRQYFWTNIKYTDGLQR